MEIENLISEKDLLKNELKTEKQYVELFNKPNESKKYFKELMRSSGISFGLWHPSTKKGESSRYGEMRYVKSKGKLTCYHCGKLGHTKNIYQRKNYMQNHKPKFVGYYFYYKNKGCQIQLSKVWA